MGSLLFCFGNWSTGMVAGLELPTFVADHDCVTSPPQHDDTHGTFMMMEIHDI